MTCTTLINANKNAFPNNFHFLNWKQNIRTSQNYEGRKNFELNEAIQDIIHVTWQTVVRMHNQNISAANYEAITSRWFTYLHHVTPTTMTTSEEWTQLATNVLVIYSYLFSATTP